MPFPTSNLMMLLKLLKGLERLLAIGGNDMLFLNEQLSTMFHFLKLDCYENENFLQGKETCSQSSSRIMFCEMLY